MLACHPSQRTPNYSDKYPKLKVAPGSYVAMKYYENGHVTQPWVPAGKPDGSGTVWVFGTYNPSATEKITDILKWSTDGTGGNGNGWLMTSQSFDDGRCHQLNSMPISINRQMQFPDQAPGQPNTNLEQLCETDLKIPVNAKVGSKLTTYWIWSWDTSAHTEGALCGKDEYYTTCSDFDVIDGGANLASIAAMPFAHTLGQQDPQTKAVSNYQSRTALTATPTIITDESCTPTGDLAAWVTRSSVPASITVPTTIPAGYKATTNNAPMPTYKPNAPAAVPNAQPNTTNAPKPSSSSSSGSGSTSTITLVPSSTAPISAPISISFKTITIYGTPPVPSAASIASTVVAAAAVVSPDGVVSENKGSAHQRHARDFVRRA